MFLNASVPSLDGAHYFVIFLDNCTTVSSVYFNSQNTKFIEYLLAYNALAKNELLSSKFLYTVCSDLFDELMTDNVKKFIDENRMKK